MKIAVCVSGAYGGRNGVDDDIERRYHFPTADHFYLTWEEHVHNVTKNLSHVQPITVSEPIIHYHPWTDNKELSHAERENWFWWNITNSLNDPIKLDRAFRRTKQILAHAHMVKTIPPEYDLIIRARFDLSLSKSVNFEPLIRKAYEEQRAIGVGRLFGQMSSHPKPFHEYLIRSDTPKTFLCDHMIIHHRNIFDPEYVFKLHDECRLFPAELGWWQVLSEPHGSNHINVEGGASPDRFVRDLTGNLCV